ncbi:hypothetical protein HPB47_023393 [Ixodes persulcatus]|uniref:Uncharacterized protein n=1 Tax=Ixodes persulcatus TaxID=34615 RepID=A0AC60Q734_IXOPE|nr:hypothetical protein HPB47_023393 [Ixodes persulcatus]
MKWQVSDYDLDDPAYDFDGNPDEDCDGDPRTTRTMASTTTPTTTLMTNLMTIPTTSVMSTTKTNRTMTLGSSLNERRKSARSAAF